MSDKMRSGTSRNTVSRIRTFSGSTRRLEQAAEMSTPLRRRRTARNWRALMLPRTFSRDVIVLIGSFHIFNGAQPVSRWNAGRQQREDTRFVHRHLGRSEQFGERLERIGTALLDQAPEQRECFGFSRIDVGRHGVAPVSAMIAAREKAVSPFAYLHVSNQTIFGARSRQTHDQSPVRSAVDLTNPSRAPSNSLRDALAWRNPH
ncbi:MAG TPA: hypothetical protein VF132_03135 [Rudaea sp.]